MTAESAINENISSTLRLITAEWVMLNTVWNEYDELFGCGPERVDLLNEQTGAFFSVVQDALYDAVVLSICRLTDAPKQGKNENLSLGLLPLLIDDTVIRDEIADSIAKAQTASIAPRDWRNRKISHNDLGLKQRTSHELEPVSRKTIRAAIAAIHAPIAIIQFHIEGVSLGPQTIDPLDGARNLLELIYYGIEAEQKRYEERSAANAWGRKDRPQWL